MTFSPYANIQLGNPEIVTMSYVGGTLTVQLRGKECRKVTLEFSRARAFLVSDEGDRQQYVTTFLKQRQSDDAFIYTVDESEFTKWLAAESWNIWPADLWTHYLIVTSNELVDIIADVKPSYTWVPE